MSFVQIKVRRWNIMDRFRGRAEVITDRPSARGLPATGILILALAMALLSLVMVRPDQDDVFVVNRCFDFDLIDQSTEARPEDNSYVRCVFPLGCDF